ncbi:Glycogen phosphorylase [Granulicella sibirica]|uniref:Glycogen phosphorylase n=2 Tax=Granulicella sibirica TaxID=2479048 RepID=A0A4Q0T1V5_9BACT|nr:Glycogen phosphorylase [Granulicella sibirica]
MPDWEHANVSLNVKKAGSMKTETRALPKKPYADSDGRQMLTDLALNLHWTWNHGSDELWKRLDAELWQNTQNPWVILQTVSPRHYHRRSC